MKLNKVGKLYSRPWGNYKTLKMTDNYQLKVLTVTPKGKISLQRHFKRAEHWIVVAGKAKITVGNTVKTYNKGEYIFIPLKELHRIENTHKTENVEIIEIQMGEYLGEDDIERIEDIYNR